MLRGRKSVEQVDVEDGLGQVYDEWTLFTFLIRDRMHLDFNTVITT